jgi:hypothetical protein
MSQILATFEFNTQQLFIILEGLRKLEHEQKDSLKWAEKEHFDELKEAYKESYKEISELRLVLIQSYNKMTRVKLKISES